VAFDEREQVCEAAEKKPISNHAIAGLYYFAKAKDFIEAGMRTIEKGAAVNGKYYISSTLNELILDGKKLVAYPVDKTKYHSFYSPEMLNKYIDRLGE
jgi:dTDP-glucose pyrophosphorylase